MVTKKELQSQFCQFLAEAQRAPNNSNELFQSMAAFLMENSFNLDDEAKDLLDHFLSEMNEAVQKEISSIPDSPEKKLIERRIRTQNPNYPSVFRFRMDLGAEQSHQTDLMRDSIAIFEAILQDSTDHLMDVSQKSLSGQAGFAQYSLAISSVNEQLVAAHLIQKQYYNQAYTHIRTVMENMDKINLFSKFPEMAEKWMGEDREKYWRDFMPSKVRKALGNPGYDPIYSFFSKLGPHGTFDGVKLFSAKKMAKDAVRPQLVFWIGRCPRDDQTQFSLGFLIHTAFSFLGLVSQIFSQHIPHELQGVCKKNALKGLTDFHEKHLIPSLKNLGFNITELENWLGEVKKYFIAANNK